MREKTAGQQQQLSTLQMALLSQMSLVMTGKLLFSVYLCYTSLTENVAESVPQWKHEEPQLGVGK